MRDDVLAEWLSRAVEQGPAERARDREQRSNRTKPGRALFLVVSLVTRTSSWCDSAGLVSQAQTGGRPMGKGSGVTRGDRRWNAKKARLRALVRQGKAVAGVDMGEKRQALTVTGADGQVLARRSPQVSVHDLGQH